MTGYFCTPARLAVLPEFGLLPPFGAGQARSSRGLLFFANARTFHVLLP
ncbi:hypothetical protein DWUX_2546 [Desulfovibrio diazotrophicus]|nr:hypothetical protein DWUX_2546 [Desulfovibrio diazotrophicus]